MHAKARDAVGSRLDYPAHGVIPHAVASGLLRSGRGSTPFRYENKYSS